MRLEHHRRAACLRSIGKSGCAVSLQRPLNLGSRLIDGVAKNMADKFFTNFVALAVDGGAQAGVGSEATRG